MEPTVEGETLVMSTKMVVSPVAGVFQPEDVQNQRISVGQIIGYVASASQRVPIRSPFEGILDFFSAWPDERVRKYQVLMALESPGAQVVT